MLTFQEFITEGLLEEKLITFGDKAYPKFGHVVLLAGGAGSGKGFVLENLMGIEGRVLDVDELKSLSMRTEKVRQRVKDKTGHDIAGLDLTRPENVSLLHQLIGDEFQLPDKRQRALYASVLAAKPERKPNIIFDVTLKDLRKLNNLTESTRGIGYDPKNIHIVWVINDIQVAMDQNVKRDRVVPEDILIDTHEGASRTMNKLVSGAVDVTKYMDGQITFVFNKAHVDTQLVKSEHGGQYIEDAFYVNVKEQGKPPIGVDQMNKEVIKRIQAYTPRIDYSWEG